jgi:hypothetical protein
MTAGRIAGDLRTNQKFSAVDIISRWFSILIYHLGMSNVPVGGRSSETQSHIIDMVIVIINKRKRLMHTVDK